jgi:hypothetical protein
MRNKSLVLCVVVFFVFVFSVYYQFVGPYARRGQMNVPDFDKYLPKEVSGWGVQDKPIADSPEMLRAVEALLRYDAAVFRVYRKGDLEISVYLAYWLPGKVHPQNIDAHTPDVCWVANGWGMRVLPDRMLISDMPNIGVPFTNYREFTVHGSRLEVLYWHINGVVFRQSNSVDELALPEKQQWERKMKNYWASLTAGTKEQLFVRISVNGKMSAALSADPGLDVLNLIKSALKGELHTNEI